MSHDTRAQEAPMREAPAQQAPPPEVPVRQPVYAKVLRLRHIHPSGMVCFLFFEGAIAIAVVLALAELVSWWAVVALPVAVAATVKLNDLVAGASGGRHKVGSALAHILSAPAERARVSELGASSPADSSTPTASRSTSSPIRRTSSAE